MHELALVAAVVEHALEVLARERATRVIGVTLDLGPLSCADPDALRFCFPLAARGTPLEGAWLELRPTPLVLSCSLCGEQTSAWVADLVCGACGGGAVEVLDGRDLVIASIDIAAGDIAAGDIAAGDIAAGDIAAGDIATGVVTAGAAASDRDVAAHHLEDR